MQSAAHQRTAAKCAAQQHWGSGTTAASFVLTASLLSSTRRAHTPKPETFEFSPRVTEKSSAL